MVCVPTRTARKRCTHFATPAVAFIIDTITCSTSSAAISGRPKLFIISLGSIVTSLYWPGLPYTEMREGSAIEIAPSVCAGPSSLAADYTPRRRHSVARLTTLLFISARKSWTAITPNLCCAAAPQERARCHRVDYCFPPRTGSVWPLFTAPLRVPSRA
jgi:hypothetical protein